jgi:hypothetical protein
MHWKKIMFCHPQFLMACDVQNKVMKKFSQFQPHILRISYKVVTHFAGQSWLEILNARR